MPLVEHLFQSPTRSYQRKVWFSKGPSHRAHPLCIILDGDFYLEHMDAWSVCEGAMRDAAIPEMSLLFVSYDTPEARHVDYLYNDEYAALIAEDVVAWAKDQVPSIQDGENLICGVSLSGLKSAYIAMHYPHVFAKCLSQSGSFWLEHQRFEQITQELSPLSGQFWLSVGDQETDEDVVHTPALHQKVSQIFGVEKAAKALEAAGAQVRYHMYAGGHEPPPWKAELIDAIQWLCDA